MTDPLADHATGVELQLEELVVRRDQADRQGWPDQVRALDAEIAVLQLELGRVAEKVATDDYPPALVHDAEPAAHLNQP